MERPAESPVGRTIAGRYLIEELIGSGAMGSVYRARQTEIDKLVAIKILRRDLTAEPSAVARFKREAKTASRLDHPNSVRMLDYGEADGTCFLVMELLEGKTLFTIAKEEWPLSQERIVDILRQVLAALAVAHDLGIVHRDLKPENIVVRRHTDDEGNVTDVVKVCDFGVAKMNASRAEAALEGSEMLTSHGVVVGTPEYMSPEQARAEPCDGRSDIYAVGIILYQLLVGRVPFLADAPVSVLLKHVIESPRPPTTIARDVDPKLEEICLKALSKDPSHRYATARDMRSALRAVWGDSTALASDTASLPRVGLETGGVAGRRAATVSLVVPSTQDTPSTRSLRSQLDSLPPPQVNERARLFVGIVVAGAALLGIVALMRGSQTSSVPPSVLTAAAATAAAPAPVPSAPRGRSASGAVSARAASVAAPSSTSAAQSSSAAAKASATPATALAAASSTSSLAAAATGAATATSTATPAAPSSSASTELLVPVATASAAPAADAAPASTVGRVVIGGVRCGRAATSDVLAVMPIGSFTRCYRDELRAHAGLAGNATLHLHIETDGFIDEASFAGPQELAETGRCIAKLATGHVVRNAQPGTGNAEVDLSFKPE